MRYNVGIEIIIKKYGQIYYLGHVTDSNWFRSAGRVMCLSPFYPDQGQLLNNTFRETLKVTTRQTIITFIATKLMGKQVGAMDLWMTKCLGIEILGQ